jgi:hypothetical protein
MPQMEWQSIRVANPEPGMVRNRCAAPETAPAAASLRRARGGSRTCWEERCAARASSDGVRNVPASRRSVRCPLRRPRLRVPARDRRGPG